MVQVRTTVIILNVIIKRYQKEKKKETASPTQRLSKQSYQLSQVYQTDFIIKNAGVPT